MKSKDFLGHVPTTAATFKVLPRHHNQTTYQTNRGTTFSVGQRLSGVFQKAEEGSNKYTNSGISSSRRKIQRQDEDPDMSLIIKWKNGGQILARQEVAPHFPVVETYWAQWDSSARPISKIAVILRGSISNYYGANKCL